MNIIVGATGQVGSYLLNKFKINGLPVRVVVRNPAKVPDQTIEIRTADLFYSLKPFRYDASCN